MAVNFATLTGTKATAGSLKSYANADSFDAEQVLIEAEDWIYERLRVRQMLVEDVSLTMTIGQDYVTIPTALAYLAAKHFMITGVHKASLKKKPPDEVRDAYRYDSNGTRVNNKPTRWFPGATRLHFDSPADVAYPTSLLYWAKPARLASGNATNFLTDRYSRILRCAGMGLANEFLKNQGEKQHWLSIASAAIDECNAQAEMDDAQGMAWQ